MVVPTTGVVCVTTITSIVPCAGHDLGEMVGLELS
jgi:hypothetical protein